MPSARQRKALTASVSTRFPKGGMSDPLARVSTLGNSFKSVDRLDFKTERSHSVQKQRFSHT
jgi:hypothetical protein